VRRFLSAEYDVRADFYKRIREGIVGTLRERSPLELLDDLVDAQEHPPKREHFPAVVTGFHYFHEQHCAKGYTWFEPPQAVWTRGEVSVKVNPELGFEVGGTPYLVKLYMKEEKLLGNRAQVVNQMMRETCGERAPSGCVMAVLDLRRGKVASPKPKPDVAVQLDGEAAYWAVVARSLRGSGVA